MEIGRKYTVSFLCFRSKMATYNLKVGLFEDSSLFYFIAVYSVLYPIVRDRLLTRELWHLKLGVDSTHTGS